MSKTIDVDGLEALKIKAKIQHSKIWGMVIVGVMALIGCFFGSEGYKVAGLVIGVLVLISIPVFFQSDLV